MQGEGGIGGSGVLSRAEAAAFKAERDAARAEAARSTATPDEPSARKIGGSQRDSSSARATVITPVYYRRASEANDQSSASICFYTMAPGLHFVFEARGVLRARRSGGQVLAAPRGSHAAMILKQVLSALRGRHAAAGQGDEGTEEFVTNGGVRWTGCLCCLSYGMGTLRGRLWLLETI